MTTSNFKTRIEFGLNVAIAVAIVVIAGVLAKRAFFANETEPPGLQERAQQLLGTRINVPGADWARNKKSLVFFLKKDCVYCEAVAPSYRQLITEAEKLNVKLIAILPNSLEDGRQYVGSLGLPIAEVQTGTLAAYKIPGTPSVMVVDGDGVVRGIWIGAEPGREKEMLAKLISLL
jgi:peroxiredoxin